MHRATAPIASAAWILAKATALTDPDSRTATATAAYGRPVTAITAPGRTPTRVTQFSAKGMGHSLAEVTDVLTAGLDLDRPEAGCLLVVASHGHSPDEADPAQATTAIAKAATTALTTTHT
ncbi:hypothetical protein SSP35_02_03020 [Streptomyces sp. NBRC 110611]|uniref:hypothetical protein n=1 Tax=Streptomyces sp. NBRC 110611 TaxID=1621259 RepID=UPI00083727A5|nr:hypothetical protein [Streptomyces sp. NBRC 110611]GAU65933.1 hypothetical protein SSP35_02_03020 [Streptomyces sp. NBRC 110611]